MNWFYAQNGRQAGPVEDAELDRLVQSGAIKSDTLVWHSGLPNWVPYAQARAGAGSSSAVTQPGTSTYAPAQQPSPYAPAASTYAPAANTGYQPGQVVCSECHGSFPADEVVQVEGLNVCANCKPVLLQKLREGVRPTGAGLNYAGFWIRFVAVFIDGIIVQVVSFMIGLVFGAAMRGSGDTSVLAGLLQIVVFLLAVGYEVVMIGMYGATLGKMACGLQVVNPMGGRISMGRSVGRYFAKILSGVILGIGYLMAAFDAEKRALHDQICDTRVVVKPKG